MKSDAWTKLRSESTAINEATLSRSPGTYVSVRSKFFLATLVSISWFVLSFWLARFWISDLSQVTGSVAAHLIIFFIALLPGFLNAHLVMSVVLDKPPALPLNIHFPPISLLIAAYNEEKNIGATLEALRAQDYPAPVEIIVVDDGSTDNTTAVLRAANMPNLRIVQGDHGGKAAALNKGLEYVKQSIVVCIDADTLLHGQALRRIVARLVSDPPQTAAVAGCVLVKNSRQTFLTRLQEWDYFTGIASAKRQQSLYQGTLVAQGAFSAFRAGAIRAVQGWPSVIGEDIVVTWALLKQNWRVGYEATAIGFTEAPTTLMGFMRQRKRWARGMIEGLKRYGGLAWKGSLSGFFVAIDFIIPVIDVVYTFAFLPGIVLALMGYYYLAGPQTLLVLPLAFLVVLVMYRKQSRVFDAVGLKVRRNLMGFFVYMLVYQILMSPVCVAGYVQEVVGMKKRW